MFRTAFVLLVVVPALALAQQSAEVTKYLQAAITLYENLEYAKALAQVQKARTKAKSPDDEARCSVLEGIVLADMGKDDKAGRAFQAAFSIDPELKLPVAVAPKISALAEKNRDQVKKMLAPTLAAQKAEDDKRKAEEQAKLDAIKAEEDRKRAEAVAQQQREDEERRKAMQPPPAVVTKPGISARALSWIPLVVTAVCIGVAAERFSFAGGRYQLLTTGDPATLTPTAALAARDAGKSAATVGWLFTGAAIAGVAAAAVMFFVGAPASTPAVSVLVGPEGGSVAAAFNFDLGEVLR